MSFCHIASTGLLKSRGLLRGKNKIKNRGAQSLPGRGGKRTKETGEAWNDCAAQETDGSQDLLKLESGGLNVVLPSNWQRMYRFEGTLIKD